MADISDKVLDSTSPTSEEDTTSGDSSSDDESATHLRRNSVRRLNRNISKGLKLEKIDVDEVVQLQYEDMVEMIIPAGCLMGYIVGKQREEADLEKLRKAWKFSFQIRKHPSGWVIFNFDNEEQKNEVLNNGPYFSSGCPWLIKEITAPITLNDDRFCFIPTWITMPGLSMECWSAKALSKITSRIGNPIATDHCTAMQLRHSFARILVEVDARKPLVREVPMKFPNGTMHKQAVHFEFEPRICSTCKQVGHSTEKCRSSGKPKVHAQPSVRPSTAVVKGSYADAVKGSYVPADGTKAKPTVRPAIETNKVKPKDAVGTSTANLQVGKPALVDGEHSTVIKLGQPSELQAGTSNAKASSIKISDSLANQKHTKAIEAPSGRDCTIDDIDDEDLELQDAEVDEEDLTSNLKGKSKQNQVSTSNKRGKKKGKK